MQISDWMLNLQGWILLVTHITSYYAVYRTSNIAVETLGVTYCLEAVSAYLHADLQF